MKYVWTEEELPQGSPEWHEWRKGGLGGSGVACLMYESPYESIQMSWEIRTGNRPPKVFSAAMAQGNQKEPEARDYYEERFGDVEALCAVHPSLPWVRCSFDGVRIDRTAIVEIKCPKNLANHRSQTKAGTVPKHRRAQLQWQLAIANALWGVDECHYWSYWNQDEYKRIVVPYNRDYTAELIRRGEIFLGYVERKERPPVNLFREKFKVNIVEE